MEEEKLEELESQYRGVLTELNSLKIKVEGIGLDRIFQLKEPLDPVSSQVIKRRVIHPVTYTVSGTDASSAIALNAVIFSADRAFFLESIAESHSTAEGTGRLQFEKLSSAEAIRGGDPILSNTINLAAVANVVQFRDFQSGFYTSAETLFFDKGDRLAAYSTAALSTLQGINITAYLVEI